MCKVSKEAIIRANNNTRCNTISRTSAIEDDAINVSILYNGNTYSKRISMEEVKTSFGKAMNNYGKML